MTVAKVRQWVRVIPLSFRDQYENVVERVTTTEIVKWIRILLLSQKELIERAKSDAQDIANEGPLSYQHSQRFGFVRIWVDSYKHGTYRLDLGHRSHFIGPYSKFPEWEKWGKIKFTARNTPLPYSNPTITSSYLEIEETI